jgi:molybdenum cofactor biosynthesis protein MoaC
MVGDHSPALTPFTKGLYSFTSSRSVVYKPWSRILPHMLRSSPMLFVRSTSTTSQTSTDPQANTQNSVADKTLRILFRKRNVEENRSGIIVNATRAGDETGLHSSDTYAQHDAHNRHADKRSKRLGNSVVRKHFAKMSVRKNPSAHDPPKLQADSEASSSPESPPISKENPSSPLPVTQTKLQTPNDLPHLASDGSAHMVSVTSKHPTHRVAVAVGAVYFSVPETYRLIRENLVQKGDVLGTARVAGIIATKNCPALVPLCHPIVLSGVAVDVKLLPPNETDTGRRRATSTTEDESSEFVDTVRGFGDQDRDRGRSSAHGCVRIEAKVECVGPTGVEMEALTAVSASALTVIDMVKAVDRNVRIDGVKMVMKKGGRSGLHVDQLWVQDPNRVYDVD